MKAKKQKIILTDRDKKIIELISQGYTDKEISAHMGLTYWNIRAVCYQLQLKTGTINRPHLVRWGFENNYL